MKDNHVHRTEHAQGRFVAEKVTMSPGSRMMNLTNLVGAFCAWISALLTIVAVINGCLTIVCLVGMAVDNGSVDHNWNCGVLIHGFEMVIFCLPALVFGFSAKQLLRERWRDVFKNGLAYSAVITAFVMLVAGIWCGLRMRGHF